MCRIKLNISETVNNGKCVNDGAGKALIHCYYDPQSTSKLLLTHVNWTQLDYLRADEFYYASNWTAQGGYYINLLSLKTTSTSTTTTTTATTLTSTTTAPVTSTTTTTSTSTTTTTPPVTSTTATTSTSTTTTTAPVTTTTTTTSTSTTTTTPIVTSTLTMTTKHQIITTSSIILSDTGTTFFKSKDTTRKLEITTKPLITLSNKDTTFPKFIDTATSFIAITELSMATSATILGKPSNKSRLPITSLNNQHSSNKTSKSSSKSFLVLSTIILLCIVGLVSFVIFHFYGNRQNKDESFLQHNNSDESMNSEMNESETDLSTEYTMPVQTQLKLSNIEPSRKGGRVFSQLDPDA